LPGHARHLSVRSAAASPQWATRSYANLSGDLVQVRFNSGLRRASDRSAYPIMVQVAVPLTEVDRALFPVSGEAARLAELQAALVELIGSQVVLAATVADAHAWRFLLYASETAWLPEFEARFRAAASDHEISIGARKDKRWRVFRELRPKVRNRKRDWVIVYCVVLLIGALPGVRYGIGWAGVGVAAILAWVILLPLAGRKTDLIAAQLAHPAGAFACFAYVFATIFFGPLALWWHPGSPWACAGVACALGAVITAALWPAQRKFYDRMRRRAAVRPPAGPAVPQ
jgi:hypothetical protein